MSPMSASDSASGPVLSADNPLASPSDLPYALPPFADITLEHMREALLAGMAEERAEVTAIAGSAEPPSFENTVVALERAGRLLARGRGADDTQAVIEHRLEVYDAKTQPMIEYYAEREVLVTVDGSQPQDDVTAALKGYEIAPVVGVRTWGGVIGIDGRYKLVDGTMVTQPRYSFWFEGLEWGVENYGVDPDIEVVMTPQDRANGRDPQLDTAIDLALRNLTERPPVRPPELPPVRQRRSPS